MLTISDRLKLTIGYLALRLNYASRESAEQWANYVRGYYRLCNNHASDEVIAHYLESEYP